MMPDTKYDLIGSAIVLGAVTTIIVAAANERPVPAIVAAVLVLVTGITRAVYAPKWNNPIDRAREEGRHEEFERERVERERHAHELTHC
jgi:hypothetical protein